MLSPFLTDKASEEVRGAFLLLSGHKDFGFFKLQRTLP